jgi:hypothetical protein
VSDKRDTLAEENPSTNSEHLRQEDTPWSSWSFSGASPKSHRSLFRKRKNNPKKHKKKPKIPPEIFCILTPIYDKEHPPHEVQT